MYSMYTLISGGPVYMYVYICMYLCMYVRTDEPIDTCDLVLQRQGTDVVLEGIRHPSIFHPEQK